MIFATPLAAAGFATAAGLAAVYCFRRKSPEKAVGSLLLWPRPKTVSTQSRRRDRLVLPPIRMAAKHGHAPRRARRIAVDVGERRRPGAARRRRARRRAEARHEGQGVRPHCVRLPRPRARDQRGEGGGNPWRRDSRPHRHAPRRRRRARRLALVVFREAPRKLRDHRDKAPEDDARDRLRLHRSAPLRAR